MEHELITLGILFFFALVGGVFASKFKQPILMGLLLVEALIGPNMFGLITDMHVMDVLIEFGAILILFVLGLEFDIPRLKKLGLKPVVLASLNVGFMTFAGFCAGILLGFDVTTSLFLGLILSFGSTVIIAKVLENKGLMNREEVPLIIAVLIIDDIIAVITVTFLSGLQDKSTGIMGSIETLMISISILILSYVLFVKFIKPAIAYILTKYGTEEIRIFAALAIWAGFAYLAFHLKLSPAVGAFMAGSIVTSLPNTKGLKEAIEPYNLIISSFFFIAIGTLISFQAIIDNIMIIGILVMIVIVMKLTAYSTITYLFANMKGDKMFFLSVATFAVGEFSLLIAKEATKFNVGLDLISIAAAVISISAIIMSLTINFSDRIYQPAHERLPYRMRTNVGRFADYIRVVSEEIDLDNKNSQGFRKNISRTIIGFLTLLVLVFGWRKIIPVLLSKEIVPAMMTSGYIIVLALIAANMFFIIFAAKKVLRSLSEIFANATNTRSVIHSRKIVTSAFLAIGTASVILLFPFFMFMGGLAKAYLIVPLALMFVFGWQLYRLSALLKSENQEFYSARKFEFNVKNGWKI